jgi:hypothetical protein
MEMKKGFSFVSLLVIAGLLVGGVSLVIPSNALALKSADPVEEALTNITKHAHPERVELHQSLCRRVEGPVPAREGETMEGVEQDVEGQQRRLIVQDGMQQAEPLASTNTLRRVEFAAADKDQEGIHDDVSHSMCLQVTLGLETLSRHLSSLIGHRSLDGFGFFACGTFM